MAASLYETLESTAQRGVLDAAGASLDEYQIGIRKGLEASFAAILGSLERSSGDSIVMSEVARHVGDQANGPGLLTNAAGLLGNDPNAPTAQLSSKLLATLFGERQSRIVAAIARSSGISAPSAATILGASGSMVLALLARKLGSAAPTANALSALLSGERGATLEAVPPYMRPLIGLGPQPGSALLQGLRAGGARSLALLLAPLALVLALFWYVLPPISGRIEVRAPELPPLPKVEIEAGGTRVEAGPGPAAETWRQDTAEPDWAHETPSERAATRTESAPEQPSSRTPSDYSWGERTTAGATTSSSSTTTTAELTPAQPSAQRPPPIAGLIRVTLQDGTEIDIVPNGLEAKLIDFIEDRYSVIDKTRWFDFDRLRFMSGSTELTPGSRAQIRNVAKILKAYPNVAIKIGGYTDNVGNPDANMRLSDVRSRNVMAAIVKHGIAADRLAAEGYGEQHPIADNAMPEGRAKNRRTAASVRRK